MQAIKSSSEIIIHIDTLNYISFVSGENIENPRYKKDFEDIGETALCMSGECIILNGDFTAEANAIIMGAQGDSKLALNNLKQFFHACEIEFGSTWSTLTNSPAIVAREAFLRARNLA